MRNASNGKRLRARLSLMGATAACLMMSACGETVINGAGCSIYAGRVAAMPDEPVPETAWGDWVADTDDAMTGGCT